MGRDVFLIKPKYQFIYPNEENVFVVPNHEKKGDYYKSPCLSHCQTNFNSKQNYGKRSFLYETKSLPFIPMSIMSLVC